MESERRIPALPTAVSTGKRRRNKKADELPVPTWLVLANQQSTILIWTATNADAYVVAKQEASRADDPVGKA